MNKLRINQKKNDKIFKYFSLSFLRWIKEILKEREREKKVFFVYFAELEIAKKYNNLCVIVNISFSTKLTVHVTT